jgi:predicted nucleotidyltransferase
MISPGIESVRLTDDEKHGILRAVEAVAHRTGLEWKSISIFGSRADLSRKGGDIDLYIRLCSPPPMTLLQIQNLLRSEIQDRIGEQKLDLVLDDGVTDLGAFGEIIARQKRELWTK